MKSARFIILSLTLACGCDVIHWKETNSDPTNDFQSADQHTLRKRIESRQAHHQDASDLQDDLADVRIRDSLRQ